MTVLGGRPRCRASALARVGAVASVLGLASGHTDSDPQAADDLCPSFVQAASSRSDLELALFCRGRVPLDVCREMQRSLGARPWSDERVASACRLWETRWQPRVLADVQGDIQQLGPGTDTMNATAAALEQTVQDKAKLADLASKQYAEIHHKLMDGSVANKSNMTGVNSTLDGAACNKSDAHWANSSATCAELAAVLAPPPSLGKLLTGGDDGANQSGNFSRLFTNGATQAAAIGYNPWMMGSLAAATFATTVVLSLRRWPGTARKDLLETASDSEEGEALMSRQWEAGSDEDHQERRHSGVALLGPLD